MPTIPQRFRLPARVPPGGGVPEGPLSFRAVRLLVGVVAGLFGAVLAIGALGPRVYGDVTHSVEANLVLPDDTELPALRERSYVYAADGSVLAVLHDEEQRQVVDFDDLPDHVWQAVLTAEDRKFFEHEGYDVEGIGRAVVANVRARGIEQGGSTITQQLAKVNFLDGSQTIDRKFSELLYAMALEKEFTKQELLARYLNQVYFGAGAYGVQAAAEEFWHIDASELEPQQSALLAAAIRAPGRYDPRRDPEGSLERRNRVLSAMAEEGYLSEEEAEELAETDLKVEEQGPYETIEPYVVEAVKREFLANPAFGETREARRELLFGGGLELHTTIDPGLQDVARDAVADHFPDAAPTAAIAAVEHETGAIVALGSGQDFDALQYDLALQGRRQPGSAMKTFVMLEALRQGRSPALRLDGSSPLRMELPGETWEVRNYGGQSFGRIDMREATRRSVNTYYAQLARRVGVGAVRELTEDLGISEAAYGGYAGIAAMSIGGLERGMTPLEMASAYGVIANDGVRATPYFLASVSPRGGEQLWEHKAEERRVLDEEVVHTAIDILREAVENGTGTAARIGGWDVVGKTGTTNDNFDAWFVGMTTKLSTAVWVGHPERNVAMPNVTGGGLAAPLWRDFMVEALAGYDPGDFSTSESRVDEIDDDDNGRPSSGGGQTSGGNGDDDNGDSGDDDNGDGGDDDNGNSGDDDNGNSGDDDNGNSGDSDGDQNGGDSDGDQNGGDSDEDQAGGDSDEDQDGGDSDGDQDGGDSDGDQDGGDSDGDEDGD